MNVATVTCSMSLNTILQEGIAVDLGSKFSRKGEKAKLSFSAVWRIIFVILEHAGFPTSSQIRVHGIMTLAGTIAVHASFQGLFYDFLLIDLIEWSSQIMFPPACRTMIGVSAFPTAICPTVGAHW